MGVRYRDGCSLDSSPGLQSLISELKCGILFVGPRPSGLRQRGFQPAVPLSDPATFSFAGAAVISWTDTGP